MFKIYSVSARGAVYEREAISETLRTYTVRDGTRVLKDSDGDMWRRSLADAHRARIAVELVKADNVRGHLAALDARVAALRAKLAEVEG